jgi:hypothetical protein
MPTEQTAAVSWPNRTESLPNSPQPLPQRKTVARKQISDNGGTHLALVKEFTEGLAPWIWQNRGGEITDTPLDLLKGNLIKNDGRDALRWTMALFAIPALPAWGDDMVTDIHLRISSSSMPAC